MTNFGCEPTETLPVPNATVDAIDGHGFRRHLARLGLDRADPQPSLEDALRDFGAITEYDGAMRPTLFGLLAFGRQPQCFTRTSNCWINCVAYAGLDQAADLSTLREAKGRLDEQVASALGWTLEYGRRERYVGILREDIPLLPVAAIREAVVNAVAHRDYSIIGSKIQIEVFTDRVQVTSAGALPDDLAIADVRQDGRTSSRNERIANFLRARGYVKGRGRGYSLMRKAMREFNGTEPELREDRDARFFTVTFRLS